MIVEELDNDQQLDCDSLEQCALRNDLISVALILWVGYIRTAIDHSAHSLVDLFTVVNGLFVHYRFFFKFLLGQHEAMSPEKLLKRRRSSFWVCYWRWRGTPLKLQVFEAKNFLRCLCKFLLCQHHLVPSPHLPSSLPPPLPTTGMKLLLFIDAHIIKPQIKANAWTLLDILSGTTTELTTSYFTFYKI